MIERERNIRKGRFLAPWNYTSPQGKAALAWWEENKDDPQAVERVETLKKKLREPLEDTKPKRRFERDPSHDHQPAGDTT